MRLKMWIWIVNAEKYLHEFVFEGNTSFAVDKTIKSLLTKQISKLNYRHVLCLAIFQVDS